MSEFTRDQLELQFKKMPEEVKEAIVSFENAKIIKNISDKHDLHIDQTGELAEEVGLILLGLTKPYMLQNRLSKALAIDRNKTNQIIEDLNERLFSKLQNILKTIDTNPQKEKVVKSVFDQKLGNLFTSSSKKDENYNTPNNADPYLEPLE